VNSGTMGPHAGWCEGGENNVRVMRAEEDEESMAESNTGGVHDV